MLMLRRQECEETKNLIKYIMQREKRAIRMGITEYNQGLTLFSARNYA